jgi:methionine biosynthesis protein MetW
MAVLTDLHYGGLIDLSDTNDPRTRIVNLITPGSRVLEVGCGSGTIIGFLAQELHCQTLAVEPNAMMAAETRALGIEVIQATIDDPQAQRLLREREPYDAIIFADVLEHLRDPWAILTNVRAWLSSDGRVITSVPNVAHWSMRWSLLRGHWDYTDGYLMDRTHLRWFTQRTLRQMFVDCGYRVVDFQVRWAAFPGDRVWQRIPGRTRLYSGLARYWPGLFGYQFVVSAGAV